MTVQRAREIFGDDMNCFSDEQVIVLIQQTSLMCDKMLDIVLTKDLTVSKKEDYHGN